MEPGVAALIVAPHSMLGGGVDPVDPPFREKIFNNILLHKTGVNNDSWG